MARDFGVSTAAAGQLRTLTGLVADIASLALGRVGRGVALRDLLLAGVSLLALGSLLSAAAPMPLAAGLVAAGALSLCRRERLAGARPLVRLSTLLRERIVGAWALAELLAASAWAGTLVYAGALLVETYGTSVALTGVLLGCVAVAGPLREARSGSRRRPTGGSP